MQRFVSGTLLLFTLFCMLIATERQALAYVDPGSGLLALQSIASVAAACGYFFRRRIKSLFGGKDVETEAPLPATPKKSDRADAA